MSMKHGWDAFKVEILEIVENFDKLKDNDWLLEREAYYIELFDSTNKDKGYNRCKYSTDKTGMVVSEATREKHRIAQTGKIVTQETRDRMSASRLGKKRFPMSEEQKKKISQSKLGRSISEEHKKYWYSEFG
jgi:group I intron endonuclease